MPQLLCTTTVAAGPTKLGTAAGLTDTVINYRMAHFIACKSLAGPTAGPNTAGKIVNLGNSSAASEQPLEFAPGDERDFRAASNQMLDLNHLYMTVQADGDGLVIIYDP